VAGFSGTARGARLHPAIGNSATTAASQSVRRTKVPGKIAITTIAGISNGPPADWQVDAPDESKKALLFEKRSKNFYLIGRALDPTRALRIKSLLVLFFKKELLAFNLPDQA
jgi:hypothetical protein